MENTTSSLILKYCQTIRYKMVYILSGYRNLILLNGVGFLEGLKCHRASTGLEYRTMGPNIMAMIDAGYEELDDQEVRIYSNYIANVMNYDEDEFYNRLYERASKVVFYENDIEKSAKQQINSMFYINRRMKRSNAIG